MDEQQFKAKLHEYVRLSDTIKAISKKLSGARQQCSEMAEELLAYMHSNDIREQTIDTLGGRIIIYDSRRTESLKRFHIASEILPLVGNDPEMCERIIDKIYSRREVVNIPALSRRKK